MICEYCGREKEGREHWPQGGYCVLAPIDSAVTEQVRADFSGHVYPTLESIHRMVDSVCESGTNEREHDDLLDTINSLYSAWEEERARRASLQAPSKDDLEGAVSDYLTTGDLSAIYCAFGCTHSGVGGQEARNAESCDRCGHRRGAHNEPQPYFGGCTVGEETSSPCKCREFAERDMRRRSPNQEGR